MKMVHATLRVNFWLIGPRSVGKLSAFDNMKVVIGGVTACMTFCAYCGAWEILAKHLLRLEGAQTEDDKVLCDA
jgi:ribosomal protein S27AE